MKRFVCIHGHFYQPPRENPWLETVELQPSARPYHDWNRRITAECYAPNGFSRLLGEGGRLRAIVNNYSWISFNFGPTLLSWLQREEPGVYEAVREADRLSQQRFGYGSALAQVYNHMIMPLATRRQKEIQLHWGIQDFRSRFGRDPAGLWLPETAVDLETLEIMAEMGIRFTILAPHQASHVRPLGAPEWQEIGPVPLEVRRPYLLRLGEEKEMVIFFYHGEISKALAFEGLLRDGEALARRLLEAFTDSSEPQLLHVATDGETYGHHHRFGEMALTYALSLLHREPHVELVNYQRFLEEHPPRWEVRIRENTAWSCAHGVGRWKEDCGCRAAATPGWNQKWRAPLREALNWLYQQLEARFEKEAGKLLAEPWRALRHYIQVVLDPTPAVREAYLAQGAAQASSAENRIRIWKLLEMMRHAQLMFTSCGWFFDDLAGIESQQILCYAARALELSRDLCPEEDLEESFTRLLAEAHSNRPEMGDGRKIYQHQVLSRKVSPQKLAASPILLRLSRKGETAGEPFFPVQVQVQESRQVGGRRLQIGVAHLRSLRTEEEYHLSFAAWLVEGRLPEAAFSHQTLPADQMGQLLQSFQAAQEDFEAAVAHILPLPVRVADLRPDARNQVATAWLLDLLEKLRENCPELPNSPSWSWLQDLPERPFPVDLLLRFSLTRSILDLVGGRRFQLQELESLLASWPDADRLLDTDAITRAVEGALAELMAGWEKEPFQPEWPARIQLLLEWGERLSLKPSLWALQNLVDRLARRLWSLQRERSEEDPQAKEWLEAVASLAEKLSFHPQAFQKHVF